MQVQLIWLGGAAAAALATAAIAQAPPKQTHATTPQTTSSKPPTTAPDEAATPQSSAPGQMETTPGQSQTTPGQASDLTPAQTGQTPSGQAVPSAQAQTGQVAAATAVDVKSGVAVYDQSGALVGKVDSVRGKNAVVSAGSVKAQVPISSFAKNDKGLVIAMTKAEIEAAAKKKK